MNIQYKTKEELINELRVLQQENNSLKALKENRAAELIIANKAHDYNKMKMQCGLGGMRGTNSSI